MKNITIGFSTGSFFPYTNLETVIQQFISNNIKTIEVNFGSEREIEMFNEKVGLLLQQFDNVSIHAPFIKIRYSKDKETLLDKLLAIHRKINSRYILFHPDIVDDFSFIRTKLRDAAAYENMDVRKSFGSSISDLNRVFAIHPEAKWVCDVNHVFTIDKTMSLAKELHSKFNNRLIGYHLSGYGDENILHTLLFKTNEVSIPTGIINNVPIIHEGKCLNNNECLKELQWLDRYFNHEVNN